MNTILAGIGEMTTRIARRLWPARKMFLVALCAGLLEVACSDVGERVAAHPNAVVILDLDTVRADGLSCYGNSRATSPAIDEIAAGGVRFDWAFAQAPNTPPSQASILTGLYPRRHGRVGDFDRIRSNVTTLAERLDRAGFVTGALVDGGFMSAGFGIERGFQTFEDFRGQGLAAIAPRAEQWLGQVGERPFLLLLHTYDAHSPYAPPEPYRTAFARMVAPPTPGFEPTSEVLEAIRKQRHLGEPLGMTPADVAYSRALYDGEIRFIDSKIEQIAATISRLGLNGRTILVVVSDHGEEFVEHGSVLHERLYATVLRVPFILRVPGWPKGRVIDEVVQTVDLVPTLLELLDVSSDAGFDGRSLVPSMRGRPHPAAVAYSESPFFSNERSLAVDDLRLLFRRNSGETELFAFRSDPLERVNLASVRREGAARLRAALEATESRLEKEAQRETTNPGSLSREALEQLRALGYLR